MEVTDDGMGLPPAGTRGAGLGLRIMAHRAEIIGWRFAIAVSPAGGTVVSCHSGPKPPLA
jgi:nitrate/nitrite-specific signal transduction histidine kinase